jgi:hypothetical protein
MDSIEALKVARRRRHGSSRYKPMVETFDKQVGSVVSHAARFKGAVAAMPLSTAEDVMVGVGDNASSAPAGVMRSSSSTQADLGGMQSGSSNKSSLTPDSCARSHLSDTPGSANQRSSAIQPLQPAAFVDLAWPTPLNINNNKHFGSPRMKMTPQSYFDPFSHVNSYSSVTMVVRSPPSKFSPEQLALASIVSYPAATTVGITGDVVLEPLSP